MNQCFCPQIVSCPALKLAYQIYTSVLYSNNFCTNKKYIKIEGYKIHDTEFKKSKTMTICTLPDKTHSNVLSLEYFLCLHISFMVQFEFKQAPANSCSIGNKTLDKYSQWLYQEMNMKL